jgi:hypothetical protein
LLLFSRELLEQVAEFEKAEFTSSNKKVIFGPSKFTFLNSQYLKSSRHSEHVEV